MIRTILTVLLFVVANLFSTIVSAQTLQSTTDYRVIAYKKGTPSTQSISNTIETVRFFNLYIPNTFTPNGDELNDTFGAVGGGLSSFSMLIFNKWGQLLYETDDINAHWDGTYQGRLAKPDSYVYMIYATGTEMGKVHESGTITLIL